MHMHTRVVMLATVDPAGPFAAVCGLIWTLFLPTSAVAAIVSVALCSFERTARQAFRLSRVGLWTGSVAFVVAIVATVATDGFHESARESAGDAMLTILLTGIAPLLALFTWRVSRRKMSAKKAT
jgi:cytochrome bd-type quinol oxidase subunit 2